MTVKTMMTIGTKGMDESQKQNELERRLGIVAYINKLGNQMQDADKARKNTLQRKLNHIKADESLWLREAAWFLYI